MLIKRYSIILTLFVLITTVVQTNAQKSEIEVFCEDGYPFFLVINGLLYNTDAATNVIVAELDPALYSIKIIFADSLKGEFTDRVLLDKGNRNVYSIKEAKIHGFEHDLKKIGRQLLELIEGDTTLITPSDNENKFVMRFFTQVSLDDTLHKDTTVALRDSSEANDSTKANNSSKFVFESDSDTLHPDLSATISIGVVDTLPEVKTDTVIAEETEVVISMLSEDDLKELCNAVKAKTFEDSKLEITSEVVKTVLITTTQLKELLVLFDFENSKIELIKIAWPTISDKENADKLLDVFEFQSSAEKMAVWMKGQKNIEQN